MTDIEKESISMSLDAICKKLYEKANPTENFDLDALCNYEISEKNSIIGKDDKCILGIGRRNNEIG